MYFLFNLLLLIDLAKFKKHKKSALNLLERFFFIPLIYGSSKNGIQKFKPRFKTL